MKKIVLILSFCGLSFAETFVGQYIIHTTSFPPVALNNMFQYAVEKSVVFPQPASMVEWISAVSSATAKSGLVRKTWRHSEPVIDERTDEIFAECDIRVEGFHPIENFINQGKITKIGYYTFDRHGYNRDPLSAGNIYEAAARRNAWRDKWRFEVEVSSVSVGDELIIDGDTYIVEHTTPAVDGSTSLVPGTSYYFDGSTTPIVVGEYDEVKGGWLTAVTGFIVVLILGVIAFLQKKD